ncbi:Outer membrane receptor proteins, mostly Fe transport [Soonwooa buanensis]|uniref:Outer membrane receptor proteins, mostly Fe transport n=1 Tax=Soonwooa buanensis TaxID=619805 RepID=A0A1T5F880_9FLAO|nr:TonB-dependent receptor [Soonwooa buanensis]SKB92357.1 Outer membrane receptor proteins, mostly Fe transport [Soonwooa buanensis]
MKINKLSIGVLFLLGSTTMLLAQQKNDTVKSTKNIEGVIIQGSTKKGKESNLINLQRKSVEVIERVGSVQLEKQGVGDVATAVTKATGTQKQEGSGQIFVRGLGDRYNGTTLNGLEIPSDNPEFKNINLEIFKTSMIEYLSLDKVYNPRFSGDFGGANIDIVSKTHVGKPYFKVGLGSSINLQTYDKANFKMQDGGPGFFGFNEATYRTGSPYDKYPFTTKWNFKNAQNPFNTSMDFEGGARLGKFMLFGYAGFDNSYEYSIGKEGFYFANGDANKDYNVEKSDYKTNTTALLNVDYKINSNNKLKFTTNYIHSSQQEAKIYNGYAYDVDRNVIINRGDNKLTDTWINQLFGNHNINDSWTLDWALAFNLMNSKRPDRMQNTINAETNEFLASSAISNHRYFDELKDKTYLGHLYLTKKFNQNYKLVVGYDGSYKDRQFNQTTLGMNFTTSVPVNYQDIDAFINAYNNSLFIYNIQKSNYSIKRNIQSGFANFDMNLSDKFTLQIGGRFDYIDFDMAWKDILDDSTRKKQYNKFLPALNAKYSINDRQNLRLSASKTYTLPQPKELIPIAYYDVTANVYGNPYLYPSDNYNADLKWEFFPKTGEIISLTAFGKYIQNPIGRSTYSSASPSDMTFFNIANWGYIYGAEAEIRKDIFSWDKSKIYAFVNGTFMQSKQELKNETELAKENNGKTAQFSKLENDVQGVAKFLANANVGYNYKWGGDNTVDLVVSYSRVGKNLYSIGTNKVGDFYELAKDILDVNINFSLKQIGIGISGKNLLNPHSKIEQINDAGTFIHKDYTRGRQVGLSLTYKFSK